MNNKVHKVHDLEFVPFYPVERINERVQEIAGDIQSEIEAMNEVPVLLGVLNGSFRFLADLSSFIEADTEIEFIKLNSYEGTTSTRKIKEAVGVDESLRGKHIYIIEDIIDEGHTMKYLLERLAALEPASVKIVTLLFKKDAFQYDFQPDYVGFEIPSRFVVGYGLDYNGLGRNIKGLYVLKGE